MIAATTRLLQERGYHGTSLRDILAESGAPRGSLYFHFPGGKEEIAVEATRRHNREAVDLLTASLESADEAATGLQAYFNALADYVDASGHRIGCAVAAIVLDAAGGSEALDAVCRDAIAEWHRVITAALERDGVTPERARALATFTIAAEEGAFVMARSAKSAEPLRTAGREIAAAVRAIA
jgi:TetR/AcrR family transcriptional regulator, lmrAB and yxaGH operons repressor